MKTSPKVLGPELGQAQPKITKDPSTKSEKEPKAPQAEPDEWETKGHLDTLMKAHEIMNDPVKMQAVHKLAGRHVKSIKSIQDIKDYNNRVYGPNKPTVGALKGSGEGMQE